MRALASGGVTFDEGTSGGRRGFVGMAIDKFMGTNTQQAATDDLYMLCGMCSCALWRASKCVCICFADRQLQSAVLAAFQVKKEWVSVDMAAKLAEKGLRQLFPTSAWPSSTAVQRFVVVFAFVISQFAPQVRELATKIDAFNRRKECVPFIFSDLKKCVARLAAVRHLRAFVYLQGSCRPYVTSTSR
jgi:hypothetical protein